MIIHRPQQTVSGQEVVTSARVELASRKKGVPTELWFRFPVSAAPSSDADPFVVALLLLAMQNEEDIEVRDSISAQLASGIEQYQGIFNSWFPERFRRIKIHPLSLREDPVASAAHEACAFSGGVDSFYTFLTLQKSLKSTLFMAGFDMPLNLRSSIAELTTSYSVMMKELGVELVIGSTNLRNFVNAVDWTNAHGQALAASALFFRERWTRFYIPASYSAASYPKWGTHPELDRYFSTESLEFTHHGDDHNRVSKLALVSQESASFERLRVCWIQDIGLQNCGECEKCVRTQIALSIVGALAFYRNFRVGLSGKKVRALLPRTYQARLFARELMREGARRRKWNIVFNVGISLLKREWFYRVRR